MIDKVLAWLAGGKVAKAFLVVKDFLAHKKTYALGTLTIMQGVVGLWDKLAGLGDMAAFMEFVRHLGDNPDWRMILAGLAMFTVKAAIAKSGPQPSGGAPRPQ